MATAACAQLNSSFVNPVRSFPNSTATFPRFASSRTLSAASLAVISGVPLLGLAVVANTNEHPRSASSASSHRSASANNQSAAHAYRIASSLSGVVRASPPRTSLARSGARPSPSLASSEISRVASPRRRRRRQHERPDVHERQVVDAKILHHARRRAHVRGALRRAHHEPHVRQRGDRALDVVDPRSGVGGSTRGEKCAFSTRRAAAGRRRRARAARGRANGRGRARAMRARVRHGERRPRARARGAVCGERGRAGRAANASERANE